MSGKRALIVGVALAAAIIVVFLWWPNAVGALQGIHGPLGGGPAMHGVP